MRLFSDVSASIDDPFLRRAYGLAVRGLGRTSPNPVVGCVIVSDGEVVGEGWHAQAGGPHAEVVALDAAGAHARGSTAYVTLEPCAHHGKTPPCTEALLEAGVSRVVIGMRDPHGVAAGGADVLRSHGVEVRFAPEPTLFEELNEGWLTELSTGRPLITAKVAVSLDGKIARVPGVRAAISGPGGRSVTMTLRSRADAVVVGARTAEIDDPALTVRDSGDDLVPHQPLRVVLCGGRIPAGLALFSDGAGPAAVLVPNQTAGLAGSVLQDVPASVAVHAYDGSAGLSAAFEELAAAGVRRVLVEPGGRLFTALFEADLIDELVLVHAGGLCGIGAPGIYSGEASGTEAALHVGMRATEAAVVDGDAVTVWRRRD